MSRKAFNFYRSYFDVANQLSDKDRLSFYDALITYQFTGDLKELNGLSLFAFLSQKHSIESQVNGYNQRLKRNDIPEVDKNTIQAKPIEYLSGAGGGAGGEAQGKGEGKEKGEEQYVGRFDFKKSLGLLNSDVELVDAWMLIRKNKKATNSEKAFKMFMAEVEKSKLTINEVLELCVKKDWKGFESAWVKPTDIKPKDDDIKYLITLPYKQLTPEQFERVKKYKTEQFFKGQS